jgi:magnesium chelatase subunit I
MSDLPVESTTDPTSPRSLRDLIDRVSGRHLDYPAADNEAGLADIQPFPFLALVGQVEMKLALILALVNSDMGGVLLVGPRGTGKTTAVRSLVDLLPQVPRSQCFYGCTDDDLESGGMDAICPDCAQKVARGEALTTIDDVRLIELPLSTELSDVVGDLDERRQGGHFRVRRGILSQADRNLLYIDEVNLLQNEIADAVLDAASQGHYSLRRGPVSGTYASRFVLIGSMNPEEGQLRPQIMDRFGLRLLVSGLSAMSERLEAYRRVRAYRANPHQLVAQYWPETEIAREEIQAARERLTEIEMPDDIAQLGLELIGKLDIASLRAEIALFEAARAHAAVAAHPRVTEDDLRQVAPMALRLRRSEFIKTYFQDQSSEEEKIDTALNAVLTA